MRCRSDLCPDTPWQKKSVNPTVPTLPLCVAHSVRRYVMHKQYTNQTDLSPIHSLPDLPVHLCLCVHHLCWLFDVGQMSIPPLFSFSTSVLLPQALHPSIMDNWLTLFVTRALLLRQKVFAHPPLPNLDCFEGPLSLRVCRLRRTPFVPQINRTPPRSSPAFFPPPHADPKVLKHPQAENEGVNLQACMVKKVKLRRTELFSSQLQYQFLNLYKDFFLLADIQENKLSKVKWSIYEISIELIE